MFSLSKKKQFTTSIKKRANCILTTYPIQRDARLIKDTTLLSERSSNSMISVFGCSIEDVYLYYRSIQGTTIHFTFSNPKYSFDMVGIMVHSEPTIKRFFIDCFHMNTVTFQVYKKLINELYDAMINDTHNTATFMNYDIASILVYFGNIDKLEQNKKNVIYSLFCDQLVVSRRLIHCVFFHEFMDTIISNFYYPSDNHFKLIYDTPFTIISDKELDMLFYNNDSLEFTNQRVKQYIQSSFCNKDYNIYIVLDIYHYMVRRITNSNNTSNNKIVLLDTMNHILHEFDTTMKLNTLKHLVFEEFVVKVFELL